MVGIFHFAASALQIIRVRNLHQVGRPPVQIVWRDETISLKHFHEPNAKSLTIREILCPRNKNPRRCDRRRRDRNGGRNTARRRVCGCLPAFSTNSTAWCQTRPVSATRNIAPRSKSRHPSPPPCP